MSQGRGQLDWQLRFENVATPTADGGRSDKSVADRWTNPLTGYTSAADPLACNVNQLNFNTPTEALEFCLKRGWDYSFPDFPRKIFKDNGDVFDETPTPVETKGEDGAVTVEMVSNMPTDHRGNLNKNSQCVVTDQDGKLKLRDTYLTYKIPPFFDGPKSGLSMPSGYGPVEPNEDKKARDTDVFTYDENFLDKHAKHSLKQKMNSDYYARDASFASHYFRPLKFHGDGKVRQHGNDQMKEEEKDVEGHKVMR